MGAIPRRSAAAAMTLTYTLLLVTVHAQTCSSPSSYDPLGGSPTCFTYHDATMSVCNCLGVPDVNASNTDCMTRIPLNTTVTCAAAAACLRGFFNGYIGVTTSSVQATFLPCDSLGIAMRGGQLSIPLGSKDLVNSCSDTVCNMSAHSSFLRQCGFGSSVGTASVCPSQLLLTDWTRPVMRVAVTFDVSSSPPSPFAYHNASFVALLTEAMESDVQRLIPSLWASSYVTSWAINKSDVIAQFTTTNHVTDVEAGVKEWSPSTVFVFLAAFLGTLDPPAALSFRKAEIVPPNQVSCSSDIAAEGDATAATSPNVFLSSPNVTTCAKLLSGPRSALCNCLGSGHEAFPLCLNSINATDQGACNGISACLAHYYDALVALPSSTSFSTGDDDGCLPALNALSIDALSLTATGLFEGSALQRRCVSDLCATLSFAPPQLRGCDFGGSNATNVCIAWHLIQADTSTPVNDARYAVTMRFDNLALRDVSDALQPTTVATCIRAIAGDLLRLSATGNFDAIRVTSFSYSNMSLPNATTLSVSVSVGGDLAKNVNFDYAIKRLGFPRLYAALRVNPVGVVVSVVSSTLTIRYSEWFCGVERAYCFDGVQVEHEDVWSEPYLVIWMCWVAHIIFTVVAVLRMPKAERRNYESVRRVLRSQLTVAHIIYLSLMGTSFWSMAVSNPGVCVSDPESLSPCCADFGNAIPACTIMGYCFAFALASHFEHFHGAFRRTAAFPSNMARFLMPIARATVQILHDLFPWTLGVFMAYSQSQSLFKFCFTNTPNQLAQSWIWFVISYQVAFILGVTTRYTTSCRIAFLYPYAAVLLASLLVGIWASMKRLSALEASEWPSYGTTTLIPILLALCHHIAMWVMTGRSMFTGFCRVADVRTLPSYGATMDEEELEPVVVAIDDILRQSSAIGSMPQTAQSFMWHLQHAVAEAELPYYYGSLRRDVTPGDVADIQRLLMNFSHAGVAHGMTAAETLALVVYLGPEIRRGIDTFLGGTRCVSSARVWYEYHARVEAGCSSATRVVQTLLRAIRKLSPCRSTSGVAFRVMTVAPEVLSRYCTVGYQFAWSRPVLLLSNKRFASGGSSTGTVVLSVPLAACRDASTFFGIPLWIVPPDSYFLVTSVTPPTRTDAAWHVKLAPPPSEGQMSRTAGSCDDVAGTDHDNLKAPLLPQSR